MAEYIDREMAINLFYTVDPENDGTDGSTAIRKTGEYSSEEIESMISDLPPADVASVRHGHWGCQRGTLECSECKWEALGKTEWDACWDVSYEQVLPDFCPHHCGAKMDGGGDNAPD